MNRTAEALARATAALATFRINLLDARSAALQEQVSWQYQDMMIFLLDRIPNMTDELEAITKAVTPQVDATRPVHFRHEDLDPELDEGPSEPRNRYLDNEAAIHY